MKKVLALLLAVIMVAAMAACGGTPAADNTTETPEKSTEFARGTWTDNVYTNESLNFKLTLPEGWVYATDEELAEIMGVVIDNSSQLSEAFVNAKVIFDLMIQDPTYGTNMTLQAENMALTVGGSKITEKDYLDLTLEQLEQQDMKAELVGDGFTTTLGGADYQTYDATLMDGVMAQRYLIRNTGKYMVFITISYLPDYASIDDVMGTMQDLT